MSTIATVLILLGLGLTLLGYVAFVSAAFRRSLLWGLAVMFLPEQVGLGASCDP